MINELFQDARDGHVPEGGAIASLSVDVIRMMSDYWSSTERGKGKKAETLEKYQVLLNDSCHMTPTKLSVPLGARRR